jgi:hypothetical protein
MQGWQTTFLGIRELPHDLSAFELQAFFTFSRAEHELIQTRRGDALKLGLALHIGFLRMSGRLLDALRVVPPGLWRHLGNELGIDAHLIPQFVGTHEQTPYLMPLWRLESPADPRVGQQHGRRRGQHLHCPRRGRCIPWL